MSDETQTNGALDYSAQFNPRDFRIGEYVWRLRAMTRLQWGGTLGAIPILPSSSSVLPGNNQPMIARREEIYRRAYEENVDGLVLASGEVMKPEYANVLAGDIEDLGELVLRISGIGGNRVEAAGRSL